MRPLGVLLLTAATIAWGACAAAQTTTISSNSSPAKAMAAAAKKKAHAALFEAAFAPVRSNGVSAAGPSYSLTPLGLRGEQNPAAFEAPFVLPAYTGGGLDQPRLLGPLRVVDGGLAVWSSDEVTLGQSGAGVDAVRVTLGSIARAHGGLVQARPDSLADPDPQAFDLRYIHGWPAALTWSGAGYALDVSPHAALGVNNAGGTAEAGAMVRLGSDVGSKLANKLGLHEVDPSTYGDRGRWYLFAAASGQAVGLNMTPGAPGLPHNSWSAETTSALISDAQAGVGWRKGSMQASFGYVHREIKNQTAEITNGAPGKISDSMLAFSLSIHPH
jgi:hypothetical protein